MEILVTEQPLVSIIVPVFNTSAYLKRCLDSLIGQTLYDIEIICIDDGSTDNSIDILNTYAQKDRRIKIIRQQNAGQSAARNAGIKAASGRYIGFVDSDDYVDLDFYGKLYRTAIISAAGIVQAATRRIGKRKTRVQRCKPQHIRDFAVALQNLNHGGVWDKLYQTEIIKNHRLKFTEGRIFEDNLFAIQALWYGKTMHIISNTCYNYVFNSDSTTTSPEKLQKRKSDSLIIAEMIMDFANKKMPASEKSLIKRFILKNFINLDFLNQPDYMKKLQEILQDYPLLLRMKIVYNLKYQIKRIRRKIKNFFQPVKKA